MIKTRLCKTCGKDITSETRKGLQCNACYYKAHKKRCPNCGDLISRNSNTCRSCYFKSKSPQPKKVNGITLYWCTSCKEYHPETEFWPRSRPGRPVLYRCKEVYRDREQMRKESMREYKKEWISKRKEKFFEGKKCVQCDATDNLMVFANHGRKIKEIRPWNRDVDKNLYSIYCQKHGMQKVAARMFTMWKEGRFRDNPQNTPGFINKKIAEYWKQGIYDNNPQNNAGYIFKTGPHAGEPTISDTYPFIENWDSFSRLELEGKELLLKVNKIVPKGVEENVRRDVCQDILLAVLSGEYSLEDFDLQLIDKFIKMAYKLAPSQYMYSLDQPLPWIHDSDTTLGDIISSDTKKF